MQKRENIRDRWSRVSNRMITDAYKLVNPEYNYNSHQYKIQHEGQIPKYNTQGPQPRKNNTIPKVHNLR